MGRKEQIESCEKEIAYALAIIEAFAAKLPGLKKRLKELEKGNLRVIKGGKP